jgi:hypothetical protein
MSRPAVESDAGLKQIVILWTTDNLVTFPQNAVTHITVGSTTPKCARCEVVWWEE